MLGEISAKNLYVLMEGIGPELVILYMFNKNQPEYSLEEALVRKVDYCRVLAPCKSLKIMQWRTNVALFKCPDSPDLQPEFYKNIEA